MRFTWLAVVVLMTACGSRNGDDDPGEYDSVEVEPAVANVTVPLGSTATQDYKVYGVSGSKRVEITTTCGLTLDAAFGSVVDATITINPHGGKTAVTAICGAQMGQGLLVVNLTGTVVIGPNTPPNAADLFNGATTGTDASRAPRIEYPIDKAVSPRNIPSIEMQWTAAGNDLFHVRLLSTYAAVDVYTTAVEALMSNPDWEALVGTAAGESLTMTVEGLRQADPATKFAGATVSVTMTHDSIDKTAIYYWASSQGNIMSQVFGSPDAPGVVKDDCTSCHSVSRSGTRIGYSRCIAGDCGELFTGFLKYDAATATWNEAVNANNRAIGGSYTTFAPVGNPFPTDDQGLAIVSMNTGNLALYNPDTGVPLPSNLSVATPSGGSALMADWSPDGNSVVYSSSPAAGQWIDVGGGSIAKMSYSYANSQHTFGTPQQLVPNPITLPSGTYTNFFFPSFSPDNELIVFNASRAAWRDAAIARAPGARLMLTNAAGSWAVDLDALNGGGSDGNVTWAHWAPTVSQDYYWIVFSSERDYGHRTTMSTSPTSCLQNGVQQCKQIWLAAVARNKLTGQIDPSAPPMWLPGQNPLANNISPYWSRPGQLQ